MQEAITTPNQIVMTRTISIFLFFLFFISGSVKAQGYESQQWIFAGVKYKMNKKWSADLEQGWRISEFAWTSVLYTDVAINYKLNKHLKFSSGYRLSFRNGSWFNYQSVDHRFYFDITPTIKLEDLRISWRVRLQSGRRDWVSSEDGVNAERTMRNKITISYELGDFSPHINSELYTPLQPDKNFRGSNQLRIAAGCDYKLNKKIEFTLSWIYQKEFNTRNPETNGIINMGLGYTFK